MLTGPATSLVYFIDPILLHKLNSFNFLKIVILHRTYKRIESMFGLFKKSNKEKLPPLSDLDDNPLQPGDIVMSLRYDLGKCEIVEEDGEFFYQSLETEKKVHWLKMVDAASENQKVKKVGEEIEN